MSQELIKNMSDNELHQFQLENVDSHTAEDVEIPTVDHEEIITTFEKSSTPLKKNNNTPKKSQENTPLKQSNSGSVPSTSSRKSTEGAISPKSFKALIKRIKVLEEMDSQRTKADKAVKNVLENLHDSIKSVDGAVRKIGEVQKKIREDQIANQRAFDTARGLQCRANESSAEQREVVKKNVGALGNGMGLVQAKQTEHSETLKMIIEATSRIESSVEGVQDLSGERNRKRHPTSEHESAPKEKKILPSKPLQYCELCGINGHTINDCRKYGWYLKRRERAKEIGLCFQCLHTATDKGTLFHENCPAVEHQCQHCSDIVSSKTEALHHESLCRLKYDEALPPLPKRGLQPGQKPRGYANGRGARKLHNTFQ